MINQSFGSRKVFAFIPEAIHVFLVFSGSFVLGELPDRKQPIDSVLTLNRSRNIAAFIVTLKVAKSLRFLSLSCNFMTN